jgi:hypothetical protein
MKTLAALLLLAAPALAQKTIVVPLEAVNSQYPNANVMLGTKLLSAKSVFTGVPDQVTDYVVRAATPNGGTVGRVINMLVGTNRAGQRVIIVDTNHNHDFGDERLLTYQMELPQIPKLENGFYSRAIRAVTDTLPAVSMEVDVPDGQGLLSRRVSFKPVPYNTGWTYPDPIEQRTHVSLLISDYRQGTVTLAGTPVRVWLVTAPLSPFASRQTTLNWHEVEQPDKRLREGFSIYEPGYSFTVANRQFEVTAISPAGNQLTVVDKGEAK